MKILALLAGWALGHVGLPVDIRGTPGLAYTVSCRDTTVSANMGTSSAKTQLVSPCYLAHDGQEFVNLTFNDGMGPVACSQVTLSMYEPTWHFRSTCRAQFTYDPGSRTCASACVVRAWNDRDGISASSRPMAFPNPVRVSQFDAMQFMNLPGGGRARIYTTSGRLVWEGQVGGDGTMHWHLQDTAGRHVASGVYIAVIENGGTATKLKIAVQR